MSDWRYPTERNDLTQRVETAEKRARIAELKARVALSSHPRDEITNLAVQLVEKDDIIARLNAQIAKLNHRLRRPA